jgi:hypothetical protein
VPATGRDQHAVCERRPHLVNDAGIEAVTFGPGNVAKCQCANDRVSLAELVDSAVVIAHVAGEILMKPRSSTG